MMTVYDIIQLLDGWLLTKDCPSNELWDLSDLVFQ